jgi:hypothetical protein
MENKLSGVQGQYFFWEPVNIDIPETEFSHPKKSAASTTTQIPADGTNSQPNTTPYDQ